MKETLIVYYSRTGFTKQLAHELAVHVRADLEEVIDKKDRSGVLGYLFSGRDAMKEIPANIQKPNRNPQKYSLIIICTPIWAHKMSTPILSFIKQYGELCNNIAFVATQSSSGAEKAFKQMARELQKKPIATLALNSKEISQNKYQVKMQNFANILKNIFLS
jgi:flavodoxin